MQAEVLVIYGTGDLVREMLHSEFTAVLDGVVTASVFAGQSAEAVYVQLNGQLQISCMVFFRLPFDAQGGVLADWNIPLRDLADRATLGPPIAGACTRLVCRSQCPQAWHAHLWEPKDRQGCDPFVDLHTRLVKRNRLRLLPELVEKPDENNLPEQLRHRDQLWQVKVVGLEKELLQARRTIDELQAANGKLRDYIAVIKAQYLKLKAVYERRRSA